MTTDAQTGTRRRLIWTFFGGVAVGRTGFILAATVSSLAGAELASTTWSGLPSAIATIGVAIGALVFTSLGHRRGRTFSFTLGYATAASGAFIAGFGVVQRSFPLLLMGMAILGLGQSTSHLARYAAADLGSARKRATLIGLIVWAGTIGAVVGPQLLQPTGDIAEAAGLSDLVGPLFGGGALFALGGLLFFFLLRPDPLTIAESSDEAEIEADTPPRSRSTLLQLPSVRLALVAMVFGQSIMVLVMTQTPVHLRAIGEGLDTIGQVMTAHTLGMFAIAPLTGFLVERYGVRRLIGGGSTVLVISCAIAIVGASAGRSVLLLPALLLLGIGWNFTFVAGSTLLVTGLSLAERGRIQGLGDTITWTVGGSASILSGFVVGATSYGTLGWIGGVASFIPVVGLLIWNRQSAAVPVAM